MMATLILLHRAPCAIYIYTERIGREYVAISFDIPVYFDYEGTVVIAFLYTVVVFYLATLGFRGFLRLWGRTRLSKMLAIGLCILSVFALYYVFSLKHIEVLFQR